MKKYYISVDCEGVSCAVGKPGQALNDPDSYSFARAQATKEANAAAKALFDSGAAEVIIWDSHGSGVNLEYNNLDKRCKVLLGSGHKGRFVGIDNSFTAILFIGYHAMEGTRNAVLAHTFSSKSYQYFKINGKYMGELEIDAAFAGIHDVPVLCCVSDNLCVLEARNAFGDIATVETKQSLSWSSAISKHPDAVCDEIYETVLKAAKENPRIKPYKLPLNISVEIRFQRMDEASRAALFDNSGKPFEFLDAYTRSGVVASIESLF